MSSSAIGSVFESVLGSMLESILRGYMRAYSQAGREHIIERIWGHVVKQAGSVQSSAIRSVYFRVYLGACNEMHLPACFQVCMQCDV